MNDPPKISVLMPSLNVGPYIRQCMDSVVNQTLPDIEILCIDAGSTDGTLEILSEYADSDPRVTLLHSEIRSYGHQINLGLAAAKGEYIGIVETDDYIEPDMFDALYAAARKADFPDVVKAGYYSVWKEGPDPEIEVMLKLSLETGTVFPLAEHYELLLNHPSIWSAIYRRDFLEKNAITMLEVAGGGWVDNPFFLRTLCEARKICWVNRPLYWYRRTNPDASSALKDCAMPMLRIGDMKDYLEQAHPGDAVLEKLLFSRAARYMEKIMESPYHTKEDLRLIRRIIRRFRPRIVLRTFAGRVRYRTREYLRSRLCPKQPSS